VGVLSLFARSREERDLHVAAIGPVWDGNEVWLLTGGGALFAAFPVVYATVFSGFYLALMLLLVALIARAVSIEFRLLVPHSGWIRVWDLAFGLGSLLPSILFGVALGNILRGVPIGPDGEWRGSFLGLLNPYAILVGLTSCALFIMHGAIYLRMKTEGALADRLGKVALIAHATFIALYAAATATTAAMSHALFEKTGTAAFWVLTSLAVAALVAIPFATRAGRKAIAFAVSSAAIIAVILLVAYSAYPILVPSLLDPRNSLTIYNAASTPRTLTTMLVIALVGMPIMLAYTAAVYRVFAGPTRPTDSYSGEEAQARG